MSSPPPGGRRPARALFLALLYAGFAVAGAMAGLLFAFESDAPFIEALESQETSQSSTSIVYDRHGVEIGQFAIERQIDIEYEDLPQHLQDAFVAAEDQRFWIHWGFDPVGIARAVWGNYRAGRIISGASTITQQVARELFENREATLQRKLEEAFTAFRIERGYGKAEILTFYANHIHLGYGNNGIEAAAQFYLGKPTSELTVGEAAMLVGLAPNPARYNPFYSRDAARERRRIVLERMVAEGSLTPEQGAAAEAEPIRLRPRRGERFAPHFMEMVRQHLRDHYGDSETYRGGLRVHTTLDTAMQDVAESSVERALRAHDKRRGFRGIPRNLLDDGEDPETWEDDSWDAALGLGSVVNGVVLTAGADPEIRIDRYRARVDPDSLNWTFRSARRLFRVGDVAPFRILRDGAGREADPMVYGAVVPGRPPESLPEEPPTGEPLVVGLEQTPEAEGAFLALESATGEIRALVGGFDFERSEFNRAVQAHRQAGSAFKPFAYGAALGTGRFAPTSLLLDEPFTFTDPVTGAVYEPHNYDGEHRGWITMRQAFEGSRNIPAVRMTHDLGPEQVVAMAQRLGISGDLQPYLSITLGSFDVTLQDMVSAYSAFPNDGMQMKPYFITRITDQDGLVLERNGPETKAVIEADLAYVITHLLEGVVARGTARQALRLNRPVAGKTGTTNDFTDAWFIGFDPEIAAGVWIGNDEKLTLGNRESGARTALPAWVWFMETARAGAARRGFRPPPNVALVPVDLETGQPANGGPNTILEAFLPGTEPLSRSGR